ncbi:esterase [Rhizocola hellebori]|uniref:Esterase n=1 Tax=Rhizocola hellebori TaxID=1392758 RepID=A0A8J3VGQ1_9ACTN|nr:PHB depolymerase family esterase [Rhizocola hellebori]GIH05382.1 esterase [Rhizocola hellebori]
MIAHLRSKTMAVVASVVTLSLLAASPSPAQAKSRPEPTDGLVEVTSFGPNPSGLQMFQYIPQSVHRHPAVVVVLHYCTGSGPAMFSGTRFAALADLHGFIVVYPSAPREGHCFDVSSPGALTHNGNSDPVGIVSMVRYVVKRQNGDTRRVFVTGMSSGAMMTNVLLGDYPDVFRAGSAMMGVPFACFATTDGSMWNSQCANGAVDKTPREWGDLARGAFPGYRGARPRMQLWHGTLDNILFYPNFGEEIEQWTDVLHTSRTPTFTLHPRPNWTHTGYVSRGRVQIDAYSVEGETHNLGFNVPEWADIAVDFFGLA